MANPTFFGDGHTPRITDTRWAILQKILGATIDGGGGGGGSYSSGAGSPNGVVSATLGSRYRDTSTGTFYTNIDGATGWAVG